MLSTLYSTERRQDDSVRRGADAKHLQPPDLPILPPSVIRIIAEAILWRVSQALPIAISLGRWAYLPQEKLPETHPATPQRAHRRGGRSPDPDHPSTALRRHLYSPVLPRP